MQTFFPAPQLSPFIKSYLVIENEEDLVNRVLPETSAVMAFRFKGKVSVATNGVQIALAPLVVSGLRKSGREIHYAANSGNILVVFRETGIVPFMKEPLHELFDSSVALDSLDGYRSLLQLEEQLALARNHEERIARIEQFLLSKIQRHTPDKLILAAIEGIRRANGLIRIKELAASLFVSQDVFEKRFRRVAGLSPKQFSYLVKMRSVVNQGLAGQPLAQIALDTGYFDQPHFNKDFKLFTGRTPSDFLKSPVFW